MARVLILQSIRALSHVSIILVLTVLSCSPPVFVTEFPLDQDLFVGKSQVIRCSAEGYPKPTFKWYKKRRLIKFPNPRFTLLSNGSLLISPVQELDTAEYICRITQLGTEEGTNLREESKDIQVTVYGTFVFLLLNYTETPTILWGGAGDYCHMQQMLQ